MKMTEDHCFGLLVGLIALAIGEKRTELDSRIDKIENAYEFMLAYAAQGRESENSAGQEITKYLNDIDAALTDLTMVITAVADEKNGSAVANYRDFIDTLEDDSRKTRAAVRMILTQKTISSQLIDNLNASIHLRALLTDLFIFDEALK